MELFFDFETSGFRKKNVPPTDFSQAWPVQLGFILADEKRTYHECGVMFAPPHVDATIHPGAQQTHGISVDSCWCGGVCETDFVDYFLDCMRKTKLVVAHNYQFDYLFMADFLERAAGKPHAEQFVNIPHVCTMLSSTTFCGLPGRYGKPKWPKLEELHQILFGEPFDGAHDALADVRATKKCYYELKNRGII